MENKTIYSHKYALTWRVTPREKVIGGVRNYVQDGTRYCEIVICHDNTVVAEARMRFALLKYVDRNPLIVVSSHLLALDSRWRDAAIWHEVGHVHHEHIFISMDRPESSASDRRQSAIEAGTVVQEEAEADDFAVARIGADALLGFITHLYQTRPSSAAGDPRGLNDLGKVELELRMRRLQQVR